MNPKIFKLIPFFFFILFFDIGFCFNCDDFIRLKEEGISEETIQVIIREKAIESCSFTVDEILRLKKAGLSEETIQIMIISGSFNRDRKPIIYGRDIRSIKFLTAKDIIELKDAGISDETIQAVIKTGPFDSNDMESEKAWDMLKKMGILFDER